MACKEAMRSSTTCEPCLATNAGVFASEVRNPCGATCERSTRGSSDCGLRNDERYKAPLTSNPVGAVLPRLAFRDETALSLSVNRFEFSGLPTIYWPRRPIAQFWPLVTRFFSCKLLFQMNFSFMARGLGGTSDQMEPF